jgi:hypothetical protein
LKRAQNQADTLSLRPFGAGGSGTRDQSVAPVENGPCCQDGLAALLHWLMVDARRLIAIASVSFSLRKAS